MRFTIYLLAALTAAAAETNLAPEVAFRLRRDASGSATGWGEGLP